MLMIKNKKNNNKDKDNGKDSNTSNVIALHKEIDISIELQEKGKKIGRFAKFDSIKKAAYVDLLSNGYRRGLAAVTVGITSRTVNNHMKKDQKFAEVCSMAETMANDRVEQSLYTSAVKGNIIAQQIWLYNRDPKRWADKRSFKVSGEGGGPIEIQHVDVKEKILDRLAKIAAAQERTLLNAASVDNKQT